MASHPPSSDFSRIADMTARSPLGEHLGWHTVEVRDDYAEFRMPFAEHNVTVANMVHGGAIAALADAAATAACWATPNLGPQARGATLALNVNYLRAALGTELVARARVVKRGRSVCVASVEVANEADELVATATATYQLTLGKP